MTQKCKRALLIINPISGGADKTDLKQNVVRRLDSMGIACDVQYTLYPGHAEKLAFDAVEAACDLVAVAGGDGTVNEVASALRGTDVALAIIPSGSGNGLARHIGLAPDVDSALDIIESGHIIEADCGTANGIPFFCTFGMGFDAAVSEKFALSKRRGLLNYLRSAVREFLKYEPASYEITTNGETRRFAAFILTVCNASQYGNNAFIAPQASIKDGLLDITVIHTGNPLVLASAGVDLFTGHLDRNMFIQTFRVSDAVITTNTTTMHIDGEPVEMHSPVSVKCVPHSLRLYTSPEKKPFRPFVTPLNYMMRDLRLLVSHPFRKNPFTP